MDLNNHHNVQRAWAKAKSLIEAGERSKARGLLRGIVQERPDDVEALLYLAHATDDPQQVAMILKAVLRLDKGNPVARTWLDEIQDVKSTSPKVPYSFQRLGRFRAIEQIGFSTTSRVFKIIELLTGRLFAIKILPPIIDDPEFAKLLENEVLVASKLNHEQIVKIYETATDLDTGTDYLVMEFVEGHNLGKILSDLTLPESVEIVKQCCKILAHCHRNRVYHRDLKPSNIMITRGEEGKLEVTLLDFGLATVIRSSMPQQSSKLQVVGTLQYRAPELLNVSASDQLKKPKSRVLERHRELEAIDVYALGVIFYLLLTKVLPFEGSDAQITYDIAHCKPVPPHRKKVDVSKAISRIVMSLLDKKPHARPTARQLYKALCDIEAWPEWLSPLAAFTEHILLIMIEIVFGSMVGFLTWNLKLPPMGEFFVFAFFELLLGGALIFFLILWFKGVRNSVQLASCGALALTSLIAISAFFFSAVTREIPATPVSALPTTVTATIGSTERPTVIRTQPFVPRPTRTPTAAPTKAPVAKSKEEFSKTIEEFFILEDRKDAVRILATVGSLFGALMGLAAMPGTSRSVNVFIGGVIGGFIGVLLGLFAGIVLGVVDTLENVFSIS